MSFSRLPYELREAIVADLTEPDLVSFALVSKSALQLARPRIWRHLEFEFTGEDAESDLAERRTSLYEHWHGMSKEEREEDESKIEFGESDDVQTRRKMRRLLTTLDDPRLAELVQRIKLETADSVWKTRRDAEFPKILAQCHNLRHFEFRGHGTDLPSIQTFDALPASIRRMEITSSALVPKVLFASLRRLVALEDLSIEGSAEQAEVDAEDPPYLPNLRSLSLGYHRDNRPLLSALTHSAPSLSYLQINCHWASSVNASCLPTLTSLYISSDFIPLPNPLEISTQAHALKQLFQASVQLESLRWLDFGSFDVPQPIRALEEVDILGSLPPSLRDLDLGVNLTPRYLVNFVSRRSPTVPLRLRTRANFIASWIQHPEEARRMARICLERNVKLEGRRHRSLDSG